MEKLEIIKDVFEKAGWKGEDFAYLIATNKSFGVMQPSNFVHEETGDAFHFGSDYFLVNNNVVLQQEWIRISEKRYDYVKVTGAGFITGWGQAIMEFLKGLEEFETKAGLAICKFGKLPDKDFYRIRTFLSNGFEGAIPDGFVIDSYNEYLYLSHKEWGELVAYDSSDGDLYPRRALLKSQRLFKLIKDCETRYLVRRNTLLRIAIQRFFPEFRFRSVNSIGEHYFAWDNDKKKITSISCNGEVSREYNLGKGLRKILGFMRGDGVDEVLTDDKIKEVGLFLESSMLGKLEVVSGGEISHYYHKEQTCTDSDNGTLGGSCMNKSMQDVRDAISLFYDNNENAKMLILHSTIDPDKIVGRALLWTLKDGTKFMDRIYGSEATIKKFKEWAKENGYIYKTRQVYSRPAQVVDTNGSEVYMHFMEVQGLSQDIEETYEGLAPYMDTFKWYNSVTGMLQNRAPQEADRNWYLCENTDGSLTQRMNTECLDCNDYNWGN